MTGQFLATLLGLDAFLAIAAALLDLLLQVMEGAVPSGMPVHVPVISPAREKGPQLPSAPSTTK